MGWTWLAVVWGPAKIYAVRRKESIPARIAPDDVHGTLPYCMNQYTAQFQRIGRSETSIGLNNCNEDDDLG